MEGGIVPLSDLPMSILFLFFLVIFLLVGLYPAWKRFSSKIRMALKGHGRDGREYVGSYINQQVEVSGVQESDSQLDDFEIMVIRKLAQSDSNGLTRKQVDADLFLGKETVNSAMQSLMRRGFVYVAISPLFRIRFYLTEQGRIYAFEHEFIPNLIEAE